MRKSITMKNLMIYISPTDSFNNPRPDLAANDAGQLVKVQIENSLALGWKKEDILIVTNFEFQHREIKTIVLSDVDFFDRKPQVSKINAIIKLFENGMIKKGETYWFHDLDAFQLEPITEAEIGISDSQIALTDFGGGKHFGGEDKWSTGVIFFRSASKDIFNGIKELAYEKKIDEEEALGLLTINNPKIRKRVKKINNSYNFIGYNLRSVYKKSIKPLKTIHFHPLAGNRRLGTGNSLRFFKGENKLDIPLITDRLVKILKYHRIRDDGNPIKQKSVAIFIPTYKRAYKILSVYKNAKDSSPLITNIYFIVEKDDQESIDILEAHRLPYFINERSRGSAGAHNTAYLKTSEQYFFIGADDLGFRPGWLEKCLEKMVDPIKVVGTNDLHNRNVLRGVFATHFLVDRNYIREHSGIFDGENLVLPECYAHNCSEREFVEMAKLRNVFVPCFEAIVEHLHWSWGLSPKDETYAKQDGTVNHDVHLFLKRKPLWTKKVISGQNG